MFSEILPDYFRSRLEEFKLPADDVNFSLSYSQGDGVAFYGEVDLEAFLRKNFPDDPFLIMLLFEGRVDLSSLYCSIYRNQFGYRYSHYNTMEVEVLDEEEQLDPEIVERLGSMVKEKVKEISRTLESEGYEIIEDQEEIAE